jgi:DNA-directed RNA polymerase subunit RPC12/RpoP
MDAYLDPFNGEGILKDMTEEQEYKCDECGEDWEGESCFGYVSDVCANCGAIASKHKVEK